FFFQAEDGIRDFHVTGVQTCALPILIRNAGVSLRSIAWTSDSICRAMSDCERWVLCLRLFMAEYLVGCWCIPGTWSVSFYWSSRSEERRVGEECSSRGTRCR